MIVFGLGNPLEQYKGTRHNVGFMVVDRLAKKLSLRFKNYGQYQTAKSGDYLILVKPMLYMNNSGVAVRAYLQSSSEKPNFVVAYDDWALPLGKIRIREKGSDGGHHGLASIIYHLNTNEFARLRIGIGPLPDNVSATDFVLSNFTKDEKLILEQVIENVCQAIITINQSGIKIAMNKFNPTEVSLATDKN